MMMHPPCLFREDVSADCSQATGPTVAEFWSATQALFVHEQGAESSSKDMKQTNKQTYIHTNKRMRMVVLHAEHA